MEQKIKKIKNKITEVFVGAGYAQKQHKVIRRISVVFQFFLFQFIKLQAGNHDFIKPLRVILRDTNSVLTSAPFLLVLNLLALLPFGIFLAWILTEYKEGHSKTSLKYPVNKESAFKKYAINFYIFSERIFLVALYLNLRLLIEGVQSSNVAMVILGMISSLLVIAVLIFFPCNMLLGYLTLPVLACCLSAKTNYLLIQILALAFLLVALNQKSIFKSWQFLDQLLKWLLLPTYLLPIFTDSINLENYLMIFFLVAAAAYFLLQQDKIDSLQQKNDYILQVLAKIKLQKNIEKRQEIKLLRIILSNSDGSEDELQNLCYNSSDNIDYRKLSAFYKHKLQQDLQNNPEDDLLKIQLYEYQASHQPMRLSLIKNIEALFQKLKQTSRYKQKIKLFDLQLKIVQAYPQNQQQINLENIINVCNRLSEGHTCLYQNIDSLMSFFHRMKKNAISSKEIYQMFQSVQNNEEQIIDVLTYLGKYPFARPHAQFLSYCLKLVNLSFQVKPMPISRKLSEIEEKLMAECYFIIIADSTIIDISSLLLKSLDISRAEVIGFPLKQIIPSEIIEHINDSYRGILDGQTISERFILPLLNKQQRIMCSRVELKCKYTIYSGLQYLISFYNSSNLQSPIFFYCAQTDKILYISEQFAFIMQEHSQKLDAQMFSHEIFTSNLSESILSNQNQTNFLCRLTKPNNYESKVSIQLSILQLFKEKKFTFALVQVKIVKSQKEGVPCARKTIKQFIYGKLQEQSEEQTKRFRGFHESESNKITFCKIPNPYESQIYEKISKLSNFRWSYLKVACILMALALVILIVATISLTSQLQTYKSLIQAQVNQQKQTSTQLKGIYQLFYQYYQYYQIKNYPHQFLSLQTYNISALILEYQAKVQSNIVALIQAPPIDSSQEYTLVYDGYNLTEKIEFSLLQFASAAKEALKSNDPLFLVQNQHNIHKIIDSIISNVHICLSNNQIDKINPALYFFVILLCISLVLKCLFLRIRAVSVHILSVYESIPQNQIISALRKLEQIKDLINYTQAQGDNASMIDVFGEADEGQSSGDRKIAEQTTLSFLVRNNVFMVIVAISVGCWLLINDQFTSYLSNSCLVLNKKNDLERSLNQVLGPAEQFYNQAMLALLPIEKKRNEVLGDPHVHLDLYSKDLPSYFQNFILQQQQTLSISICQYFYLNSPGLFGNIDCSLILDGNTKLSFMESYVLYLNLIRSYIGAEITQLGTIYRENAKYPVFMEIAFLRETLKNILKRIEKELTETSQAYFLKENQRITNFTLFLLLATLFIAFFVMMYELKRVCIECRAVVRCFKLLPKSFLMNIKTTKYLIKERILQQLQKIPF